MKLPMPIRALPSIAANPDRDRPAGNRTQVLTGGLNRAANDRRRAMPERLLTVQEAGEMLNMGSVSRVG